VINSLLFTLQLSLVYVGFTLTSASRGALITNLQPFFLLFWRISSWPATASRF